MTLLAFAFGAGMLATVNPCGFAMLPAFLSYYLADPASTEPDTAGWRGTIPARIAHGLSAGLTLSAGFAAVFTLAGLLVTIGLRTLVGAVPWAAVIIGAAIVLLGLAMVAGRHLTLRLPGVRPGEGSGLRGMAAFGAAYAVASLSCTLAVLLAVIAQATATNNPLQLVGVFTAYALGAATILTALAVAAALAKTALARGVRRLLPIVSRLGGAVLVLSGAYLIIYWLPTLTGNRAHRGLGRITDDLSAQATTWLTNHQTTAITAAAIATTAGLAAWWHSRHHRTAAAEQDCCTPATAQQAPGDE